MTNLLVIAIALTIWLLTFAAGVITSAAVKSLYAAGAATFNGYLLVHQVKTFGVRMTFNAYVKVFTAAVVFSVKSWYAAGAAAVLNLVTAGAVRVTSLYAAGAAAVTTWYGAAADVFNGYVEVVFCLVIPAGAAAVKSWYAAVSNLVTAGAAAVVEFMSVELADTTRSTYALNVLVDSTAYTAGEYLVRDNGQWRNVYLTAHARALMGSSADVIALSAATVHDSRGTSHVWTVAIA